MNSSIGRLSSLSDTSGTLESYEFLGLGTVVTRAHSQPNVDLSYVKRSGESMADAGDQYTGLDRFGRIVDQRWLNPSTGTATDRFQYGYDLVGNRLYRDNLVNTAFGELYAYDGLDQLTSFDRGTLNGTKTGLTGSASRSQDWDYDAVGNFDSVTTNGGSPQTRTANRQNEITAISGATTPTYDGNGNMTGDETGKQFVFDAWNRLVTVKNSGGTTLKTYAYDGLFRRVSETASGTTTDLYYSAAWQVLTERVGSGTTKRYVWSPVYVDAMVLRDRDTDANGSLDERLWVQQDANYNVTALVNGSGTVVERYVYDAYGVVTVLDGSYGSRGTSSYGWDVLWQGMRYDSVSGSYKSRIRTDISPTLGRPFQLDPIGFDAGDVNFYRWEGNNPTGRLDPSGCDWGAAAGAVAGAVLGFAYGDKPITDVGEIQEIIFGMKLPPTGGDADIARSNSGCIGFVNGVCLTKEEFIKRFEDFRKTLGVKEAVAAALSPETLPGVKCYKTFKDADAVKAPEGKTKIIFRKCGKWKDDKEPKGPEVPINSIEGMGGNKDDWDYAVLHGGMWTNVQNQLGFQTGYHGKDEPKNDAKKWPNCMYCVFLKDAKKGK